MHEEGRFVNEGRSNSFNDLLERAVEFVKSRKAEHWVMFFIGLMIGLVIG